MAFFSNKHTDPLDTVTTKQTGTSSNQINMVGEGTLLEGTIQTKGDIRVSGRIVGKLTVAGKIIVAQEGEVEGELYAANIDIAGHVKGNLKVDERLLLRSTGLVEGDVVTARLVIEEGAVFHGTCKMVMESQKSHPASEKENGHLKELDLSAEIGEHISGKRG